MRFPLTKIPDLEPISVIVHTPFETVDLNDMKGAVELLCAFIYAMKDKADFQFLQD